MNYHGRTIDAVALWADYVEFPHNLDAGGQYFTLVRCPNPNHDTMGKHFQVNQHDGLVHCVDGNTLVRTNMGLARAADLKGERVKTLSVDGVFRNADWKSYGVQEIFEITLDNDDILYATSHHRWLVSPTQKTRWKGTHNNQPWQREFVHTIDLEGRQIQLQAQGNFTYRSENKYRAGVRHGLIYGDGTYSQGRAVMRQYGESRQLVRGFFVGYGSIRDCLIFGGISKTWLECTMVDMGYVDGMKTIPSTDDPDYLRGFIAGLIAADGHVTKRGHVMIHQSNLDEIHAIRVVAAKAGLSSVSIRMTRERNPWTNEISPSWKLTLMKAELLNKGKPDFKLVLHPAHRRNLLEASFDNQHISSVKVKSVESTGEKDHVFCCEEPQTHSWVVGTGYLSGNCFAGCGISGTFEHALCVIHGYYDDLKVEEAKDDRERKRRIFQARKRARKEIFKHSRVGPPARRVQRKTQRAKPRTTSTDLRQPTFSTYLPEVAHDYLHGRGITDESIAKWQLQWNDENLRIVIPVLDERNVERFVIQRATRAKDWPKYLYPDDAPTDRTLFGACHLNLGMVRSQGLVLTEGSLDAIKLHQGGIVNSISILGAYVHPAQVMKIHQLRPQRIFLMFDKDTAGVGAIFRSYHNFKRIPLFVCRYPVGKSDPAELTEEEARRSIERALPFSKFTSKLPEAIRPKGNLRVG